MRGTRGVKCADPKAFYRIVNEVNARMTDREEMARDGTLAMIDVTNGFGSLPTRNNRSVRFEGANKLNPEAMHTPNENGHTNLVTNGACFGCTIGCGRICKIDPKHFSVKDRPEYHGASGGLEYETAYALGSACGVDDIDAATFAGFICNEYGMDPISLGGTIAAAMELFDIGAIDEKHHRWHQARIRFGRGALPDRRTHRQGRRFRCRYCAWDRSACAKNTATRTCR